VNTRFDTPTGRCHSVTLVVLLLSAAASAATLEDIRASYRQKFEHLRSYRVVHSLDRQTFLPQGKVRKSLRAFEFYRTPDCLGLRCYDNVSSPGPTKPFTWHVYRDGLRKTAGYTAAARQYHGTVNAHDEERRHQLAEFSPLVFVGLDKEVLDDSAVGSHRHGTFTRLLAEVFDGEARVLPEMAEVAGHPCYVVEAGTLRAWLAQDLGLAVIKCEEYEPGGGETTAVLHRLQCKDFHEYAPGLFVPRTIVIDYVGLLEGERVVDLFVLTEVELNPVIPESELDIRFAPGVTVYDTTRWFRQDYTASQGPSAGASPRTAGSIVLLIVVTFTIIFLIDRRSGRRRT